MKLFVAVMGASSYIFAQADPSEQIAKRRLEIDAIAPRPPRPCIACFVCLLQAAFAQRLRLPQRENIIIAAVKGSWASIIFASKHSADIQAA